MIAFGILREAAAISKVAQRIERLHQEDTIVLFVFFVRMCQGERGNGCGSWVDCGCLRDCSSSHKLEREESL